MKFNINGKAFDTDSIVTLKSLLDYNIHYSIFPLDYPVPEGVIRENIEESVIKKYKNREITDVYDLSDIDNIEFFLDDISSSFYEGMKKFTSAYNYLLSDPEFIEYVETITSQNVNSNTTTLVSDFDSTLGSTATNNATKTNSQTVLATGTIGNTGTTGEIQSITANNELQNTMTDNSERYTVNEKFALSTTSPYVIDSAILNPADRQIEKINANASATKGSGTTSQDTDTDTTSTSTQTNNLKDETTGTQTDIITDTKTDTKSENKVDTNTVNGSDTLSSMRKGANKEHWRLIDDYCNSKSLNPWNYLYSELDSFFVSYRRVEINWG